MAVLHLGQLRIWYCCAGAAGGDAGTGEEGWRTGGPGRGVGAGEEPVRAGAGLPLAYVSLWDPGSRLMGRLQQRHSTVVPRSWSSSSMYFLHSGYGHRVMKVMVLYRGRFEMTGVKGPFQFGVTSAAGHRKMPTAYATTSVAFSTGYAGC
jgi:hypothetical protein